MDYPGEKLLLKMWESLADKGIGGLLAPWQEKRMAETRAEIRRREMLLLAQAEKEVESIKSGSARLQINSEVKLIQDSTLATDNQDRVEPKLDLSELATSVANADLSESIRKEANVAKSIMVAEDILSSDQQEPSEKPIEDDWLFSWRDYAGRVSASELQDLWGRILAGEVKQPGSYSMRTLEFLKGLSKTEAELISKAARFVIGQRIYRDKEKFLEKEGLVFSHLLLLQDIGVLSGVEAVGLNTKYRSRDANKFFLPLVASNRIMLLEHEDQTKTVKAGVYLLTQVGVEVLKLASFQVDEEYFEAVAKDYAKQGYKVKIADWVQQTAEGGQYFNARDVHPEENA